MESISLKMTKNIGQRIILFNTDRRATNFARPKFRDRIPPQLPADSPNERNCRTRPRTSWLMLRPVYYRVAWWFYVNDMGLI